MCDLYIIVVQNEPNIQLDGVNSRDNVPFPPIENAITQTKHIRVSMTLFSFVFAAEIQEALSIHAHYASSFRTVLHRPRFSAHPPQSPPLVDAVKDPNQSLSHINIPVGDGAPLNVPGGDGAPASNSANLTGSQIADQKEPEDKDHARSLEFTGNESADAHSSKKVSIRAEIYFDDR